jgi:hypothetical protein
MPAMHHTVLNNMSGRLTHLKARMVGLIPFDLTHSECIHLVAPSEHISILTEAAKVADISAHESWFSVHIPATIDGETGVKVEMVMRTHEYKVPPLRPRAPFWQIATTSTEVEAGEKVIAWVNKRLELGRRFGLARWTLYELAQLCDTGTQIRYLWPVVMHLCVPNHSPRMDAWVEKHAAYKPVRHAPVVSPQLKKAIQDSSALLTSAVLVGEDVEPILPGEVQIDIWNLPSFELDGKRILRQ